MDGLGTNTAFRLRFGFRVFVSWGGCHRNVTAHRTRWVRVGLTVKTETQNRLKARERCRGWGGGMGCANASQAHMGWD